MTKKSKFIRKCLKYREFNIPVFHLENLPQGDFNIAWQMVSIMDKSGVPFVCVLRNTNSTNELNIHTYGFISKTEQKQILQEIVEMYLDDTSIKKITFS
jgi:hypothetical protein